MADYVIRNSLNPNKVVKCSITFRSLVNKGDEGEPIWVVQISTNEPHKDGGDINPEYLYLTTLTNLDLEIRQATENISVQVDWGTLQTDIYPPEVVYNYPSAGGQAVDLNSEVVVDIEDFLPSAGIDPSSIKVFINDTDVTDEVSIDGDPYKYRVIWKPSIVVEDYYDG